jgi:hypothetical protein
MQSVPVTLLPNNIFGWRFLNMSVNVRAELRDRF